MKLTSYEYNISTHCALRATIIHGSGIKKVIPRELSCYSFNFAVKQLQPLGKVHFPGYIIPLR